jgi:hypothetical protein
MAVFQGRVIQKLAECKTHRMIDRFRGGPNLKIWIVQTP